MATVTYAEETYDLREGDRRRFGRDDAQVEIPIWSAIHTNRLSRVAGELWCQDGQVWLRNLSTAHELELVLAWGPPLEPLPRRDPGEPVGPATSRGRRHGSGVRTGSTCTCGSGARPGTSSERGAQRSATRAAPPVPDELRPVAAALCEPLLLGGPTPATYTLVAQRLGLTRKGAILRVEKLLAHYEEHLPGVQGRARERALRTEPQLVDGRWLLPDDTEPVRGGGPVELPLYHELGVLLVRRRLVVPADLELLPAG